MKVAGQLVSLQVEHALDHRGITPFSRKVRSAEYASFGISGLDFLASGVPMGALTEMVGPESSGRTTVALSVISALVQGGGVCAWVDIADALDPESAEASGVDLARLLWVRCGEPLRSASEHCATSAQSAQAFVHNRPGTQAQVDSPHPRSEGRGMPEAIGAMLKAQGGLYDRQARSSGRVVGTPGAPNRSVSYRSEDRKEQVNSDRLPARRGDNLAILPRCVEPQLRRTLSLTSGKRSPVRHSSLREDSTKTLKMSLWKPLDHGLRTTDLLLHNGGFSAIVLDLGGIPPEFAWRIPLATWFRFRAACERTRTSLILLTQHPCARSSAELVLRLQPGIFEAHGNVMVGIDYNAVIERNRFAESEPRIVSIRKSPQSVQPGKWKSGAAWA